jgi:hypothetical protein
MKMMVHVNRFELKKGKKGFPWTIHTSKGCIPAKEVAIEAPSEAQCFPERKTNPKCFIVVYGIPVHLGEGQYVLLPSKTARRAAMSGNHDFLDVNNFPELLH